MGGRFEGLTTPEEKRARAIEILKENKLGIKLAPMGEDCCFLGVEFRPVKRTNDPEAMKDLKTAVELVVSGVPDNEAIIRRFSNEHGIALGPNLGRPSTIPDLQKSEDFIKFLERVHDHSEGLFNAFRDGLLKEIGVTSRQLG